MKNTYIVDIRPSNNFNTGRTVQMSASNPCEAYEMAEKELKERNAEIVYEIRIKSMGMDKIRTIVYDYATGFSE